MNHKMPRTPFSTPLSGSAREAELRLRNIFSGPKKRPPALFLALVFAVCIFCGNLVSCQVAEQEPPDVPDASLEEDPSGSVRQAPLEIQNSPLREALSRAGRVEQGEGAFYWAFGGDGGHVTAYWKQGAFSPQELFTLDYSGVFPEVSGPEMPPCEAPVLDVVPFENILGQQGALFTYDKGGRQVQHFWYLDPLGNPAPLALCDPGWQTGDLDGDGNDELWSVSENGCHCYLYTLLPAEGRPRFAFVCGGGSEEKTLFRDLERVEQEGDAFILCLSDGERRQMSGEDLMFYLTEGGCWTYTVPDWTGGGRVDQFGNRL